MYSEKWILDSISEQKVLDKDDYLVLTVGSEDAKKLKLLKNTPYTIREVYAVYELSEANPRTKENKSFW